MGVESGAAKGSAEQTGKKVERGAAKAARNPVLEWAGRAGWLSKGLLYLVMGSLILGLALGRSGATDQRGILRFLSRSGGPWGEALVIAVAVALAAHALWNLFSAVFDPLGGGDDPSQGPGRRLGFAGRGVAYLALLFFCAQLVSGRPGSDSDSFVPKAAGDALNHPFGPAVTVIAGLIAIVVGVVLLVQTLRRSPEKKDLRHEEMSGKEEKVADALGRFGSLAYGLLAIVIGWFVIQAAVFHDPKQAKGVVGAFGALAQQPVGRLLLGLIAIGFLGLGLYSLAAARWMRLPGPPSGGSGGEDAKAAA
jgi:hypothetical protein